MKKSKILFALVAVFFMFALVACVEVHYHSFGEWEMTKAPTETVAGVRTRKCTACNIHENEDIAALTDESVWTFVSEVESTCVKEGSRTYSSKEFGEVTVTLPLAEHKFGDEVEMVKEPTETETGTGKVTCPVCENIVEVEIPALSDESVWTLVEEVKATCQKEGSRTYSSEEFGEVTVTLPLAEHEFAEKVEMVEEPTETEAGKGKVKCSVCGEEKEVEIPALSDESVWSVAKEVKATCTKEGSRTYSSEKYGEVTITLPVVEHQYGEKVEIVEEPTETEAGKGKVKCSVCENEVEVEIPALSDESVWSVVKEVKSTCEKAGSRTYSSEKYGEVTIALSLAEHEFDAEDVEMVEEPTETEAGKGTVHCTSCDKEVEVEIPALSDADVWEITAEEAADYNQAGSRTYTSVYGEVTVVVKKLVAPYDGKTYSTFNIVGGSSSSFKNEVIKPNQSSYRTLFTIDENGEGVGTGSPFNGNIKIKMINPETGEIEITVNTSTYRAYVDMETGIIVRPWSSHFGDAVVVTPFQNTSDALVVSASALEFGMAMDYIVGENTYSIYMTLNRVYFGVSFTDAEGNTIEGADCYKAPQLYVKDAEGNVIFSYGYDGENRVELDGFEGTYTGEHEVVVSGTGTLTVDGSAGTYEIIDDNTLGAYVDGEYFVITVDKDEMTCEVVKPMVTITYVAGDYAVVEPEQVNINVVYKLPVPTNNEYVFKGWFYDEDCTMPVEDEFIPTVDVTLYATWKLKVVVNLVGVKDGDETVLYLGDGDIIGDFLPKYGVELDVFKIFRGWFLDADFQDSLPEDAEVTVEDSGITLYAKWDELPPYYGKRLGTEIWNKSYGNSSKYELTIDEYGNISGVISGKVQSYDPETKIVTYVPSNSSTTTRRFFFDPVTDVIIVGYSNAQDNISDYYIFSKYTSEKGTVKAAYGIQCYNPEGSAKVYLQVITLETPEGDVDVVFYCHELLSNITITDTAGNPLTASTVKNSKTILIKDKETGEIIYGFASSKETFDSNELALPLDEFFGVYTNGEETIILDGVGGIIYGEKTGTYKLSDSEEYQFDVFLEDNTEYYHLTLVGDSFILVKYMVTITFVVPVGNTEIPAQEFNANVVATLPDGKDEGFVFNGWFFDELFTEAVPANFIPTEDITLYAKYSLPAVLTIVYNNGEENLEVIYSQGDVATVEVPLYKKHAFVGWFTTPDFQEESKWESGTVINEDTTIYAKWEVAPIYNNVYSSVELEADNDIETGKINAYGRHAVIEIDPYGVISDGKGNVGKGSSYPFAQGVEFRGFDPETNQIKIWSKQYYTNDGVYVGYVDPVTGIMILFSPSTNTNGVIFWSPFETAPSISSFSVSHWNHSNTMAIDYTFEGTTYSAFVHEGQIYFNVKFEDAEGATVAGGDVYNTQLVFVKDSEGNELFKFGKNNEGVLQDMDGLEGTYHNGEDTLVLDGVINAVLCGEAGKYYHAPAGSFYTLDLYVNGAFYEVTLNTEDMTYTIVMPMVVVAFNTDGKAIAEPYTVNRNIPMELPELTSEEYIFRGWFYDEELTRPVVGEFIPTTSLILYAKWDAKVIVKVVYGNGLDDVTTEYGVGDVPQLQKPIYTDGKVFNGWFLDAEFETPYVEGTPLVESITVYCKWLEAVAMYGSYKGFNSYGASANPSSGATGSSVNIDVDGKVTGTVSGTIQDFDPETGVFKLVNGSNIRFGFYDIYSGALAFAYSSTGTSLGTDFYIFVPCNSMTTSNSDSSLWNSNRTRLLQVTVDGVKKYIFVNGDRAYFDVTYTSTDGEVASGKLASANQVTIYDKSGKVLAKFEKVGSALQEVIE